MTSRSDFEVILTDIGISAMRVNCSAENPDGEYAMHAAIVGWKWWQAACAHTRTEIIDLVFAQLGKTEGAAKVVQAIRASAAP